MLPAAADEFSNNVRAGEVTGPCKRSSASRGWGRIAHNARTGTIRTSIMKVQVIVEAGEPVLK